MNNLKLTGLINTQPVDDDMSELESLFVLYSGALASALQTRSGIGYKLNECDASGQ